jgi:GTP-binding protein
MSSIASSPWSGSDNMSADTHALPIVAIVGRPNVGKSSLANRFLGRREAVVAETPGVTRDRRRWEVEWSGHRFTIVDTGGLEPGQKGLEADVAAQARVAIASADLILLVVDVSAGPIEDDLVLASSLRRSGKPVVVAANKVDDPRTASGAADFFRLGLGEPRSVSALHGTGSGDLLDAVVELLPDDPKLPAPAWASLALVGRPNVGKSSLLNALLGEGRALVAPDPGTTRDPVDATIALTDGRELRLVDTAGMRRQVRIDDPIEYFSFLRARDTLARADVAVLVVDATSGVTGHDQRIAQAIVEAGKACVVLLNKWDAVTRDETDRARLEQAIEERLRFLPWGTRLRVSALTGRGVDRVVPAAEAAVEAHRRQVTTSSLNDIVQTAQRERPPPRAGGKNTRIRYAVQTGIGPPTIALFSTGRLETSYLRYLERRLRAAVPLEGTPVRMVTRPNPQPKR